MKITCYHAILIAMKEVETIKQIIIRIDDTLHKQLKLLAIENNTSIQKIAENLLKEYVKNHQK